jgi:AhpD family alkylhydroperoxidase
MHHRLVGRIESRMVAAALRSGRYVRPVAPDAATGLVADVYAQLHEDFVVAGPLVLHSPSAPLLAAAWSLLRETSIAAGRVPRADKEAIAAGVSAADACPYCVEVHTMMLGALGAKPTPRDRSVGGAAEGSVAVDRFVAWGRRSLDPHDPIVQRPPFPARDAAEVVGTAVTFHYVNRMATRFLGESPFALPPATRWLRGVAARAGAVTLGRRIATRAPAPGASTAASST